MGTVGEGWGVERGTVPSSVAKRMVGSVGEGMVRVWGGGSGRRGGGGICAGEKRVASYGRRVHLATG